VISLIEVVAVGNPDEKAVQRKHYALWLNIEQIIVVGAAEFNAGTRFRWEGTKIVTKDFGDVYTNETPYVFVERLYADPPTPPVDNRKPRLIRLRDNARAAHSRD